MLPMACTAVPTQYDRQLSELAGGVCNLVELMSAMSNMPGFGGDGFDGESPPISEWLHHEAEQFGAATILASARWNGSERQGQTSMGMELVVERKAVGGYKGPDRKSTPSMLVKLDGIGESNPLARSLPPCASSISHAARGRRRMDDLGARHRSEWRHRRIAGLRPPKLKKAPVAHFHFILLSAPISKHPM